MNNDNEPADERTQKMGKPGSRSRPLLNFLLPVLVYALLILYLSVLPVGDEPPPEKQPSEPVNATGDSPAAAQPARSILFMKYNVPFFDMIANISIYLIFGILVYRSLAFYLPAGSKAPHPLNGSTPGFELKLLLMVIMIGFAYSSLNELAQLDLASRVSDVNDVVYNTIGTGIGAALFITWNIRKKFLIRDKRSK